MFAAWCEKRGVRVLIPTDHVMGITNSKGTKRVVYRCWCDDVSIWETTSAPARTRPTGAVVPAVPS